MFSISIYKTLLCWIGIVHVGMEATSRRHKNNVARGRVGEQMTFPIIAISPNISILVNSVDDDDDES